MAKTASSAGQYTSLPATVTSAGWLDGQRNSRRQLYSRSSSLPWPILKGDTLISLCIAWGHETVCAPIMLETIHEADDDAALLFGQLLSHTIFTRRPGKHGKGASLFAWRNFAVISFRHDMSLGSLIPERMSLISQVNEVSSLEFGQETLSGCWSHIRCNGLHNVHRRSCFKFPLANCDGFTIDMSDDMGGCLIDFEGNNFTQRYPTAAAVHFRPCCTVFCPTLWLQILAEFSI